MWAMFPAGKVAISPMALNADPTRATLRYEYFRMRGPTKRPESTDMRAQFKQVKRKFYVCPGV